MLGRRKLLMWAVSGLMVVWTGVLYAQLSAFAGHTLHPQVFWNFLRIAVKNAAFQADLESGKRSLELAQLVLSAPLQDVRLGSDIVVALPPDTARKDKNTFITFSSPETLQFYLAQELPAQGWKFTEGMGSVRFFRKDNHELSVVQQFYLGRDISSLKIDLRDLVETKDGKISPKKKTE